ncbi:MAG: class I SAM-dependent methyltransferase [Acidimicrobiales bacterium]
MGTRNGHVIARRGAGRFFEAGLGYDLGVWFLDAFLDRGKVTQIRQEVLALAGLEPTTTLLDVGCGTGALAIAAAKWIGTGGAVSGIDISPRQISRARSKARRAGLDIDLRRGSIDALPFSDQGFDVVTATLMLHHLGEDMQRAGVAELMRVLKPPGRIVVAELSRAADGPPQAPHRRVHAIDDVEELLEGAGLAVGESSSVLLRRPHKGWSGARIVSATAR